MDPAGLERREQLMGAYGALIDECLRAGEERCCVFGLAAGCMGACASVVTHAAEHDCVQRLVELAVA